MAKLLRDVINIPERVGTDDFVFKLAASVLDPEEAVANYIVTDELVEKFADALNIVRTAVQASTSRAVYLDSSFGGGKSHFMGVLRLLLENHPTARGIPELAGVVNDNTSWIEANRFLTPTFHLVGSLSLEEAVLGGYVRYVHYLHPDAELPDVFVDTPILANAVSLRQSIGDDAFFAGLNKTEGSANPWNKMRGAWDAATFDEAIGSARGKPRRDDLVRDLVRNYFAGYSDLASRAGDGYVGIDEGLGAISRHAQSLGYTAVVLFLDELILWLISNIADIAFVTREAQKISKLVEGNSERPVPIVSFVARQRDLRELVSEETLGRDRLAFVDTLKYWDGRFVPIKLSGRNLPVIANKRLLQPKEGGARTRAGISTELSEAFDQLRLRPDVRDILMTADADEELFRMVYPFSPAFVTALVDVAEALQRERTALRVLLTLLVNRRDELTVGDLVPVGDLYDALDSADTPFTGELKASFAQARKLYDGKLRPMLLQSAGVTEADAADSAVFRGEDRIIKTLLLAALVPGSTAFKDLTLSRLVTLNHGSIRTPLPNTEQRTLLGKLRGWVASAGEIRLSTDPQNPLVSIQLSSVDIAGILDRVRGHDSDSARRITIRERMLESLALNKESMQHEYATVWRGVKREVDLVFGNIRDPEDLPDENLMSLNGRWKVLIDFPFDDAMHGPADDFRRLRSLRDSGRHSRTVAWLPAFFNSRMQTELGQLVLIDHLLTGDNFERNTAHLSLTDRDSAKILLENQQGQLRIRLDQALLAAYQLEGGARDALDDDQSVEDHFPTLQPDVRLRPPVGADLKAGLDSLLGQVFEATYPGAPKLGRPVPGRADLGKILDVCKRAASDPLNRVADLDSTGRRLMKDVAEPLRLGVQHDQPFVLSDDWDRDFVRKESAWRESSGASSPLTVGVVQSWLDEPDAMGLPAELANLIVLVWAAKTNRRLLRHGGPIEERVESLPLEVELRAQAMPTDEEWKVIVERSASLFGLIPSTRVATAGSVAKLGRDVRAKAEASRNALRDLSIALGEKCSAWGVTDSDRHNAVTEAFELGSKLIGSGDEDLLVLRSLSQHEFVNRIEVVGKTWTDAAPMLLALQQTQWSIIDGAAAQTSSEGERLSADVRSVLSCSQIAQPLEGALRTLLDQATRMLSRVVMQPPLTVVSSAPPVPGSAAVPAVPVSSWSTSAAAPVRTERTIVHTDLTIAQAVELLESIEPTSPATARVTIQIDGITDLGEAGN
jgi:hypothetical protein